MKRIHIKKPDIKGFFTKVKNLKPEDIKRHYQEKKARRQRILEQRRNSKFAKKMQPVYKWMNRFSLVLHYLLACVLNFLIEMISRHSFFEAWSYMTGTPLVFLFNAFLIFATFMIVYLFRRRVFVRILLSVFWLFLGACNGYLLLKRVTPFNAQDLKVLSDALELTSNYFNGFEIVMLTIGIAAVVLWVISMWRRGGQYTGKMHRIIAVIAVVASGFAYVGLTDVAIDKRVISNYFGNIAFAYEDYGFPYCFAASLFNTGINQPAGYSEETMAEINKDGCLNVSETSRSKEELPNIMFVQLESYFDPTEVEWLRFSEDPIPNLRKLYADYSSGYFKVPSVGAGTANTEFEVLTGMNMRFFGPGEYPYKTYVKTTPLESAASALASLGYGAEALHNNGGNFYSRAKVYNNMGFDHYTSKEFMNILKTTPKGWATDDILVPNIMESLDTTDGTDFVCTISVQGHGDYPTEPTLENPEIKVTGVEDEGKRNAWEYYVNEVHEMDKFVGQLIDAIEQRGEPTVLVFYGDHLPTLGLEAKDLKGKYLYNTNYVIWDNIGLEKKDGNIAAYQIMADVFDRLDIHTGTIFNYHQQRRQTKNYLADLELLQYDIMYGKQYVYKDSGAPITEGHMVMGVKDATITSVVEQLKGTYSIYGENFTKQSKVYINGEKQTTKFLNNTRLDLKESEIKDGDQIMVAQCGSSNTIFRTSKTYEYTGGQLVEVTDQDTDVENGRQAFVEQKEEKKKMTYKEIVTYIEEIPRFTRKHSLDHTREMLLFLGNPQNGKKIIHVAGTNGKGSVCAYLDAMLRAEGKSTGLFTSPHLVKMNERIVLNGKQISDEDFCEVFEETMQAVRRMQDAGLEHPTFFEFLFAMAMKAYDRAGMEYIVLETGLGGRLDATSSVEPVACVITSIGLDHMEYLGDTVEQIAGEKAGIIRPEVPVFFAQTAPGSDSVIEKTAEKEGCFCKKIGKDAYEILGIEDKHIAFSCASAYYGTTTWKLNNIGTYQPGNALLAMEVMRYLFKENGHPQEWRIALARVKWAGRMEEILPKVYVDGAHNVSAIQAFVRSVPKNPDGNIILFSAVKDKEYEEMISYLCKHADAEEYVVTLIDGDRATDAHILGELFRKYTEQPVTVIESVKEAMQYVLRIQGRRTVYCLGSLYLTGMIKEIIQESLSGCGEV